jgi:Na+/melibiose symporter-like transporter
MRRLYGQTPLHLLAHAAAFAVAAYAMFEIVVAGPWQNFAMWFFGAAFLHDLVLLPLYSLLDALARHQHRHPSQPPAVLNHLRVPGLLSGLSLVVYFPLILGLSDANYTRASGHHEVGYLRNWLALSAVFFLASAVVYAVRLRVNRLKNPIGAPNDEDAADSRVDGDGVRLPDSTETF